MTRRCPWRLRAGDSGADGDQRGFVEIEEHGRQRRFTDCSDLREDHCAVQEAVAAGQIDPRRYESYRRLMNLVRQSAGRG